MVASPPLANPLYIAAIDSQHQFIDKGPREMSKPLVPLVPTGTYNHRRIDL
jgi:hypothetical protein